MGGRPGMCKSSSHPWSGERKCLDAWMRCSKNRNDSSSWTIDKPFHDSCASSKLTVKDCLALYYDQKPRRDQAVTRISEQPRWSSKKAERVSLGIQRVFGPLISVGSPGLYENRVLVPKVFCCFSTTGMRCFEPRNHRLDLQWTTCDHIQAIGWRRHFPSVNRILTLASQSCFFPLRSGSKLSG